jgi:hypothetical protein
VDDVALGHSNGGLPPGTESAVRARKSVARTGTR